MKNKRNIESTSSSTALKSFELQYEDVEPEIINITVH
jgi:hypothetical protein